MLWNNQYVEWGKIIKLWFKNKLKIYYFCSIIEHIGKVINMDEKILI